MIVLQVDAPFAACRPLAAGWYRPASSFLTPSAAYGLLLNLAGVETRLREEEPAHQGGTPATQTRSGLPAVRLALGAATTRYIGKRVEEIVHEPDRFPRSQVLYQQLHNYPVGSAGEDRASSAFGGKYNITPVRREVMVGLHAVIAIDGNPGLEAEIVRKIAGDSTPERYGLPFLGDNSFLPDRIELLTTLPCAHWYERIGADEGPRPRSTRLTVWVDRVDMTRTISHLYAPVSTPSISPPRTAWVDIPPPHEA